MRLPIGVLALEKKTIFLKVFHYLVGGCSLKYFTDDGKDRYRSVEIRRIVVAFVFVYWIDDSVFENGWKGIKFVTNIDERADVLINETIQVLDYSRRDFIMACGYSCFQAFYDFVDFLRSLFIESESLYV